MSSLPQLMMTALEDALLLRMFIFGTYFFYYYRSQFQGASEKRLDTPVKKTYLSAQLIGCFGDLYLRRGRLVIEATCQVIFTSA